MTIDKISKVSNYLLRTTCLDLTNQHLVVHNKKFCNWILIILPALWEQGSSSLQWCIPWPWKVRPARRIYGQFQCGPLIFRDFLNYAGRFSASSEAHTNFAGESVCRMADNVCDYRTLLTLLSAWRHHVLRRAMQFIRGNSWSVSSGRQSSTPLAVWCQLNK